MATLLISAKDNNHSDPVVDRRGCYKKGYVVVIKPDTYTPSRSECLPSFVLIRCPEVTEAQANNYMTDWQQTIDYTVNSNDAATAIYNITVFGDNTNASGEAAITQSQVENFLNRWNASVTGFATNSVTFDFALWQALQSEGFWDRDISAYTFALDNYDSASGQADVTVSGIPDGHLAAAQNLIAQKGGLVDSSTSTSITFNINRSVVLSEFQADVKEKTETRWCRKQFYFSTSLVDEITLIEDTFDGETRLTSKGQKTMTQAEVIAALNDKLSE